MSGRQGSPSLWSNGAFVRVWAASTISVFGSLITRLALPFVAIYVLDAGPVEVGILRSIDLAATLVFGLVAGAWVDRLRRRPVLIWSDLLSALVLATVPLAFIGGWLSFGQLIVVAAVAAVLATFFDAADNAYLPTIVGRDRLVDANSALTASWSAAELTGFGISGILVQALTAPIAILVDAVTFLVSALMLATIRRPEPPPPPAESREPVIEEIRTGIALVRRDPILRALTIGQVALEAGWGFFGAVFLLFAVDDLGLGAAAIGIIAGVGGAASLAGAVATPRAIARIGVGWTAIWALVLTALGAALIPLAPAGAPLIAIGLLIGQQLLGDSAATAFDVVRTSVQQSVVDDRQLGRVSSTVRVAAGGAQLVTTLVAGLLGAVVGLRVVLALGPVILLLGAVVLWRSQVRQLGVMPDGGLPSIDPAAAAVEHGRDEPIGG
jgi:MFS family permease